MKSTSSSHKTRSIKQEYFINSALIDFYNLENYYIQEENSTNMIVARATLFFKISKPKTIKLKSSNKNRGFELIENTDLYYRVIYFDYLGAQIELKLRNSSAELFFFSVDKEYQCSQFHQYYMQYQISDYESYLNIYDSKKIENGYSIYDYENEAVSFFFSEKQKKFIYTNNLNSNHKVTEINFSENMTANLTYIPMLKIIPNIDIDYIFYEYIEGFSQGLENKKKIHFNVEQYLKKIKGITIFPHCKFDNDILLLTKTDKTDFESFKVYMLDKDENEYADLTYPKETIIVGEIKANFDFHKAISQLEIRLTIIRFLKNLNQKKVLCLIIFKVHNKNKIKISSYKKELIRLVEEKFDTKILLLFYEDYFLGKSETDFSPQNSIMKNNLPINFSNITRINLPESNLSQQSNTNINPNIQKIINFNIKGILIFSLIIKFLTNISGRFI